MFFRRANNLAKLFYSGLMPTIMVLTIIACSPQSSTYSGPDRTFATNSVSGLSMGYLHGCAITGFGTYCWGSDLFGELGDQSQANQTQPVLLTNLLGYSALYAGNSYTCGILSGGIIKCWGYNYNATLGNSGVASQLSANCTAPGCFSLSPVTVEQLGGGGTYIGATAVSAGNTHACLVSSAGGAACWGLNYQGELGNSSTTGSKFPVQPAGLTTGVTAVATGHGNTTCAIILGTVQCWGDNTYGQVGDGTTTQRTSPVAANVLTSSVTAIALGQNHGCAIQNGAVLCWGYNAYGQVGDGTNTNRSSPMAVSALASGATALALGDNFSCALVNGGVQCWGYNGSGALGTGSASQFVATPTAVTGMTSGVTAISAGQASACALKNGSIYCWGDNSVGELGTGDNISQPTPVKILDPQL